MHLERRLGARTALRNGKVVVAACAIALLSAGLARAAVVVGPGDQQSPAGQTVEWTFSVTDDSDPAILQSGTFTIPNVTESGPFQPVLKGTTNNVDCTIAERLKDGFTSQTKWLGTPFDRVAVTWAYIPDGTPATITSGELMTCKFTISPEATGPVDLGCTNQDASDPEGNIIEGVTCQAGTLAIGEAPSPTPTETPTATPTETPPGAPYVGCYHSEFESDGTPVTVDMVCAEDGTFSGKFVTSVTLTCNGTCDTQTGVVNAPCTGAVSATITGTLPQPVGQDGALHIKIPAVSVDSDFPISNVPCPEVGTPTPTASKTPTKTPGTPAVIGTLIDESGCQMTANTATGTPWALIIPAAALLVLRRRRG